jgi:hypothetical protein
VVKDESLKDKSVDELLGDKKSETSVVSKICGIRGFRIGVILLERRSVWL